MRILVTSCPNNGHFFPMVPFCWALRNAGHEVLAAVPDKMVPVAVGAGIPAISIGDAVLQPSHDGMAPTKQSATVESLVEHVLEFYVPLADRTVDAIIGYARSWRAELILHTGWEYAGPIAAAACGIPSLLHTWGLVPPAEIDEAAHAALRPLCRSLGVPDWYVVHDTNWIDVCPPALSAHQPAGGIPMSYVAYNGAAELSPWLLTPAERPRVCVTLGNIPILGTHDSVAATVIEALGDSHLEVVIAAADRLTVETNLPSNIRVARRLPLRQLLPTCALSINHGGAGSAMASIITGLPQLVLPQMCVQYQHARQLADIGAGEFIMPEDLSAEAIRSAVGYLLQNPGPTHTVQRLRAQLAERPSPAEVVLGLESSMAPAPQRSERRRLYAA